MLTRRSVPPRAILLPLLFSAALLGTGCEESPTGRKQVALVPEAQMTALGEQGFAELLRTRPLNDNPAIRTYVGCVAEALVDALPQPHGRWSIAVFDDPTPNAFALPGGKIGVHSGMLRVARTPDQLAAVIAHEIAHVLADHANERLTQELAVQGGLMLPYSRTHEREADRIGRDLMAQAGFDPRAGVALWRNMAAIGGGQPPAFLSTHPSHDTRMEELAEGMEQAVAVYRQARDAGRAPTCSGP